ncbi:hypothetical protein D2917_12785 [Cupriavidus oxalaticus]|uniref:Uncharacterized protein n=1 Tax=Cupriavidus oxalaticus TaxID=96344 RepID=A0A5P3VH24_9BURK|nr:hypothetical protein D2917_12785 [Cupriavidus oxalaticus]
MGVQTQSLSIFVVYAERREEIDEAPTVFWFYYQSRDDRLMEHFRLSPQDFDRVMQLRFIHSEGRHDVPWRHYSSIASNRN